MKEILVKGAEALQTLAREAPVTDDSPKSARDVVKYYSVLIKEVLEKGHSIEATYKALEASGVFNSTFKLKLETFKFYVNDMYRADQDLSRSKRQYRANSKRKQTLKEELSHGPQKENQMKHNPEAESKSGYTEQEINTELERATQVFDKDEPEGYGRKRSSGLESFTSKYG